MVFNDYNDPLDIVVFISQYFSFRLLFVALTTISLVYQTLAVSWRIRKRTIYTDPEGMTNCTLR